MKKTELYVIQDIAKIRGNRYYIFGDNPLYRFEPGTSEAPHEIVIEYNEEKDIADIKLKISNDRFLRRLAGELNSAKPHITRLYEKQSKELKDEDISSYKVQNKWTGYIMQIADFSRVHVDFANTLRLLLDENRFNLPSLVEDESIRSKFEGEDDGTYSLKCNIGMLCVPEHVCHGADYKMFIAGYDSSGFDTPEELLNNAKGLVELHRRLKNDFPVTVKNNSGCFDFSVKAKAESKHRIKKDLETIIGIVRRQYIKKN